MSSQLVYFLLLFYIPVTQLQNSINKCPVPNNANCRLLNCCQRTGPNPQQHCCLNALINDFCDVEGRCICDINHFGDNCSRVDYCEVNYKPESGGNLNPINCGEFATCDRERSEVIITPGDALVCNCSTGWEDRPQPPPPAHTLFANIKCRVENPCESSANACNLAECGTACQCTRLSTFHPPRLATGNYSGSSYSRYNHTCTCGPDYYHGRNRTDIYYRPDTCFRKKCITGPGGTCTESDGDDPRYTCNLGYSGSDCTNADFCIIDNYDQRCRAGGDTRAFCPGPIRVQADLRCNCGTDGYSGEFCDVKDYCRISHLGFPASTYCGTFGECDSDLTNETTQVCKCDPTYVGVQCAFKDGCERANTYNLCQHALDPTCITNDQQDDDFSCGNSTNSNPACQPGWEGEKCNIENRCETLKECNSADDKCQGCCVVNKSITITNTQTVWFDYYEFVCNCTDVWDVRPDCEIINKCNDAKAKDLPVANCTNGQGNCTFDDNNPATCVCNDGFYGDFCQWDDYCFLTRAQDPCNTAEDPGNTCVRELSLSTTDVQCLCVPGFDFVRSSTTGKFCIKDPCFQVSCFNSGTPNPDPNDPTKCLCACLHDFRGDRCEFDNGCDPNPCHNGFQCNQTGNNISCDCAGLNNYTPFCEILDMCLQDPKICDSSTLVTSAVVNPCINTTGIGEYSCNCTVGWVQDPQKPEANCFLKDLCNHMDTKCMNPGATGCFVLPGTTKPICFCNTTEYYFGDRCQNQHICSQELIPPYCNDNNTASCNAVSPTSATCVCHTGFHGIHCEYQDLCVLNTPCQNNGTCTAIQNTYTCACLPLYNTSAGRNCEFENGCVRLNNPCRNGFNCTARPNALAVNDWTCNCGMAFLNKPDCSERDPCVLVNPCQNGGTCRRVNDSASECDCSRVPDFLGDFCEIERGRIRLVAYPSTANVGEQQVFILIVEKRGTEPTFKINFGDSFNFEISDRNLLPLNLDTIQAQRGILNEEGIAKLRPFANQNFEFYPFTHIYNSRDTFTVETIVFNGGTLSQRFTNKVVADTIYCLPVVTLQNCGRSRLGRQDPNVPTYERKSRFVIESSLYYRLCQPTAEIKFKWNLFRLTDIAPYPRIDNEWEITGITAHENDDQKHIIFLPYNLLQGEYWIQLFVYYDFEDNTNLTLHRKPVGNLDWCYFNLKNSPPIARIDGGNARTIHFHATGNAPLILNASSSIDQNDPTDPKLNFEWNYRIDNNLAALPCSQISRSSCTASWIEVNVANLDQTRRYTFHVDVQSNRLNEMSTSATASQEVTVVDEGLEIVIRCIENCFKFNPGDTVHMECDCRDCDGVPVSYDHMWNPQFGNVTEISPTTYHLTLGQDPTSINPLEFVCNGFTTVGNHRHEGKSALPIVINKPPLPGNCSLTQPARVTFLQEFSNNLFINCQGFNDPEPSSLPLIYEVNAIITENGTADEILPNGILLLHDVYEKLPIFYLPMGENATNYDIRIQVDVSDALGLPAETSQILDLKVFPSTLDVNSTSLAAAQDEFRNQLDLNFGFVNSTQNVLVQLLNAGDNQKALQLILSVLYTLRTYNSSGSELGSLMQVVNIQERQNISDRMMAAIRQIPLYSHLIVKQVMQSLYLLSYYAEFLTNETLLSCAEQLISTAQYFRNFVLRNEEVIYNMDIAQLARAGKYAAENIMVETEKRGRKLLDKDAALSRKTQEVQLQHLYQKDRDYFLEVDELTAGDQRIVNDQPEAVTLTSEEIETVKRMSSICRRAFISIIHLLEAIASREVLSSTSQITLPASIPSKVTSSVDIFPVEDLPSKTRSGIIFPQEIVTLIQKQNTKAVQLHYSVSEIDAYFGDFGIKPQTNIFIAEMKVDGNSNDGAEQWIRISETIEPIRIRIPFKTGSTNILNETIDEETNRTSASSEWVSVVLVDFDEIFDVNPNIQMYHLSLIRGSTFYMVITTRSQPLASYAGIEYQAALTMDYRPTAEDFCRQDTNHTRRFSSGDVIEFKLQDSGSNSAGENDEQGDYLDYYVGIWPFDESGNLPLGTNLQFSVNFVQLSCLTRNEDENQWQGKGCEVSDFVDGDYLECKCRHLSIFAGSVVVPPNKIDFTNTVELFLTIPDNYIVTVVVCSVLGIWLICHLLAFWKDRDDRLHHSGITIMCEIGENFDHTFYLIRVVTGSRISAGTTANVSLQIYGENGRSKVYVIKDPTLSVLNRGGNDSFLISSTKHLGQLEKIRVWHDNSGPRPGWYLRKITVREVKTGQRWYFFAGTWLSMTYEKDPNIIREFPVATKQELNSWRRRFNDRLVEEFNNSHLWFSIFFRLPSSNFTRCQRLVCSVGILVSHMLFNIMWEGIPTADYSTLFEVGDFSINLRQVLLGLQIAIVATPVGIVLILLFRRIRRHRIPTLVVWQDRVQRHDNLLNIREEHIFMPDKDGEFKETVVPAPVGSWGDDSGENPRVFSVPSTDMVALEKWISQDTRGHGLRPPVMREPDAYVHKVENKEEDVNHSSASHLLRIGRRAIAEVVRRTDPTAFIYAGDGNFETQFDEEIRRRAAQNHPWTKLKKRDIQQIEENMKSTMPKLRPVQVVKKEDRKEDVIYHGVSLELCLMSPVYKKNGFFPWWFIYVSWAIAVSTILICSFLTIFFGLSIGRLRSWHWFSSISFSFIQTLVITQPLRIIIIASIFSSIYRKIHASEEDRFQVIVDDGTEKLSTGRKLKIAPFLPGRSYPPFSGAKLLQLRLKARRRNELKRGMVAFFFHILAMIFLACIISNSSSAKFAVTSHVKNMLQLNEGGEFENIKTTAEFYRYMNYFAQIVNPVTDYNGIPVAPVGDARYESTMMADNETMILGIPRIRQVRIKSTECPIHERVKQFYQSSSATLSVDEEKLKNVINCTRGYDGTHEDVDTYNPFWKEVIGNSRSWMSTNDVWIWRAPNETQSIINSGKLAKYDAGGYVAELGMQYRKTISVLNYLRQTRWIDSRTRAIFVEMSVIVPNVNIFAEIFLLLELSPAGAYVTSGRVLPLQITFPPTKGESWRTWVTVCYVGISLYTIGIILTLGRGIAYHWIHYRMGFIGSLWLWLDFGIGTSSMLSLALAFKFHVRMKRIQEHLDTSLVNEFINLQRIAFWDNMHISFFAAIFGLCIIKTWRFLILFLNRFYILALTLRLTARFLIGFMLIIIILVVAFACWGVLAFGDSIERFHSIGHAFLELKHQLLLTSFYDELRDSHAVIGRMYFLFFGLSLVLVGVNLFVALLASGFFEAKEIAKQRRHRETYWTALKKSRLRQFLFGLPREKNPEMKLPIPPLRVKAMENSTAKFIRACVQTKEFNRMKELFKFCNQNLLKGTGYFMISKKDKKKRLRDSMNTTLSVSKTRMEDMRQVTIAHLRQRLKLDLTAEEIQAYTEFHMKLLDLKMKKVRKVLGKLEKTIEGLFEVLDREEAEALEAKLRAEALALKQSAMGWRRYLPPEVLLNTSASQHRYEGPIEPPRDRIPSFTPIVPRTPKSPTPSLRRRSYF